MMRPPEALNLEAGQAVYLRSASVRRCQIAEVIETFQRIPGGMIWVRVMAVTDPWRWDDESEHSLDVCCAGSEFVVPAFAIEEVRW